MPENPAAFWDTESAPKIPFYVPFCRSVKKFFTRGEPEEIPEETKKVIRDIEKMTETSSDAAPEEESVNEQPEILDFFAMSGGKT